VRGGSVEFRPEDGRARCPHRADWRLGSSRRGGTPRLRPRAKSATTASSRAAASPTEARSASPARPHARAPGRSSPRFAARP